MTLDTRPRGRILGFLKTVPGVITAIAGLITAMVGLMQLSPLSAHGESGGTSQQPVIVNITPETTPDENVTPEQVDVAEANSVPEATATGPVQQLIEHCAAGSVDACTRLLGLLANQCYQGHSLSCDVLYHVSPAGSAYQSYGATCGGRVTWDYAGTCSQL